MRAWLRRKLTELLSEAMRAEFTHLRYEMRHDLIASIGLEDMARIVKQGYRNRREVGHTDYTNLTKMYIEIVSKR